MGCGGGGHLPSSSLDIILSMFKGSAIVDLLRGEEKEADESSSSESRAADLLAYCWVSQFAG